MKFRYRSAAPWTLLNGVEGPGVGERRDEREHKKGELDEEDEGSVR